GMLIYSSELRDPIYLDIPSLNGSADWKIFTKTPTIKDPSNFVVNGTKRIVKLRYAKNLLYAWKYPIYLSSYFLFFILFWLLQKAQRSVVTKRYETEKQLYNAEKQLMQQQMALSKKQMEPHFMLNMINNIGYLFLKEEKQNALYFLGKFGSLMRNGLIHSQASKISLEKELEFVEDYLILQKRLMDDELEYSLKVDENIDDEKINIPHSLVYTFAENAIKHGLRPKEKDRKLEIRVEQAETKTKITIKDNGVGRQRSKELHTTDTGKGVEIVNAIIRGYNQLHGEEIGYLVKDVLDEAGMLNGTMVEIWL
ncbi:MAG: hypothetical protein B7C24_17760, partial [Bacteroidetes bacterium 4572_77]